MLEVQVERTGDQPFVAVPHNSPRLLNIAQVVVDSVDDCRDRAPCPVTRLQNDLTVTVRTTPVYFKYPTSYHTTVNYQRYELTVRPTYLLCAVRRRSLATSVKRPLIADLFLGRHWGAPTRKVLLSSSTLATPPPRAMPLRRLTRRRAAGPTTAAASQSRTARDTAATAAQPLWMARAQPMHAPVL